MFNETKELVKDIDPEMSILDMEGMYLRKLSRKVDEGIVVEIGSWKGRSTIWLAKGYPRMVLAIDPAIGDEFFENLKRAGISSLVKALRCTSREAIKLELPKIGMIFIDGDHSYDAVVYDLCNWSRLLVDGGIVAFHDTIAYHGPKRLVMEIARTAQWKIIGMVGQIVAIKKVEPSIGVCLDNMLWLIYFKIYSRLFMLMKHLPVKIKDRLK